MMLGRTCAVVVTVCLACWALPACSPAVDLKQAVEVADVSSGWFDAGIVEGKNKLVPSITVRLKKKGDVSISSVSLNVVFKPVGSEEHFDEVYVQRVDFKGDETDPINVRATVGYTGDPPQTRAEMLQNAYFKDMEAQIFAKAGSAQWVPLHSLKIVRQLLTK
jgi:hypothetical protein